MTRNQIVIEDLVELISEHGGIRTKGYCVDTVGLDEDKIRQYVKYQEDKERREEQMKFGF